MRRRNRLKKLILPLVCLAFNPLTASLPEEIYPLLEICGIEHDGTLPSIVMATQKQWLRKPLQERWQLQEKSFPDDKQKAIRDLMSKMGFILKVLPHENYYNYCLLYGASGHSFKKRLNFAAKLWEQGIRFDSLVILTGERPLDPVVDLLEMEKGCKTEKEALRLIYDETPLPSSFRSVPLTLVSAPMQESSLGLVRPSTADTIRLWLAMQPSPGTCLCISSQPYVPYSNSVTACFLDPKIYPFTTVGPETNPEKNSIALLLDTTARYLYQLLEYENTHLEKQ